ncbi:hypothetical protein Daus18300_013113 [Diaporthe australafricana]|uniref:Uncharacterized protein n=1 Tax=Diaporthe australafricana TaxID=127596 RepID=A0ABR3W094_9PEZI
MLSRLPTALCLLLCSAASTAASSLATFSDAKCQVSLATIAGENGYPDGVCTDISAVAAATYKGFMFTTLDDGCARDTSSSSTSTTSLTSSTSSASSAAVATSSGVSGGAIAGAVVGSVCGLGIIAAVSAYFFWFRPKQRERKRREIEESGMKDASAAARKKDEEEGNAYLISMQESRQQSHELQSMPEMFEAPGDNRAAEIGNDGEVPVELPGDHHYNGNSDHTSNRDVQNPRR